jgi:ribonuclease Z
MIAAPVALDGPPVLTRSRTATALVEGDLRVTAIEVSHSPVEPAYAYRFDYKGRSVVISGDTVKHAPLARAAKDADVLVHEAQAQHLLEILRDEAHERGNGRVEKILSDIALYHTAPREAAEVANSAGVKLLVLSHVTPPPPNFFVEAAFTRGVNDVRNGDWLMGRDGMVVTLPLGSGTVQVRDIE